MGNDSEQLKIPSVDLPIGLHTKIMLNVAALKFKNLFIALTVLLISGAVISGIYTWGGIIDVDGFSVIRTFLSGFTFDLGFFSDLLQGILAVFPVTLMAVFAIDLVLMALAIRMLVSMRSFMFGRSAKQIFLGN